MFSVAIKHLSSSGTILASRVIGTETGKIKATRKSYELSVVYQISENNGTSPTSITTRFPSGKYTDLDYTPTYSNYRFVGWFPDQTSPSASIPSLTGQIFPEDNIVYDRDIIYAKWQSNVTVNFDATTNGGQMPSDWTAPYYYAGQPYSLLPQPTKSGAEFSGWYNASGTKITEDSIVPEGGSSLTARYIVPTYTTQYRCTTTSSYRNTGIYSATRYSASEPIVVDWGDNSIDNIDGNISQLTHTYSSNGTFTVKISNNITDICFSSNNSIWYNTTSQNKYTLVHVDTLDSKITTYPSYCFYQCSALLDAVMPTGITIIQSYCFYACTKLNNISIPSTCTTISTYAFYNCLAFTSITIPNTCNSIDDYAFYYCSYLTNITFESGNNTLTLGNYAFAYCGYYSTMTINISSREITSIPNYCFYYCRYLGYITLPDTVTTIGVSAFRYCWTISTPTSLSITIPASITSIQKYAFGNCGYLKTIRCNAMTAPTVASTTFGAGASSYTGRTSYSAGTNTLYVPAGSTGYTSSYWNSVLLDSTKCGFHKVEE